MLSKMIKIRTATPADLPQVLALMRDLAAFEDYLDTFAVDLGELNSRAFGPGAQCRIFVAERAGTLAGYAVALEIPFTYDLRPTIILKELYVRTTDRSAGIGTRLLESVAAWALSKGAGRLHWDVLSGNQQAERFYQRHGGQRVRKWIAYQMDEAKLIELQARSQQPEALAGR